MRDLNQYSLQLFIQNINMDSLNWLKSLIANLDWLKSLNTEFSAWILRITTYSLEGFNSLSTNSINGLKSLNVNLDWFISLNTEFLNWFQNIHQDFLKLNINMDFFKLNINMGFLNWLKSINLDSLNLFKSMNIEWKSVLVLFAENIPTGASTGTSAGTSVGTVNIEFPTASDYEKWLRWLNS